MPGPLLSAGQSSRLLPQLRAWRRSLRPPGWPLWMWSAALTALSQAPLLCSALPAFPPLSPLGNQSLRLAPEAGPRFLSQEGGAGAGHGTAWRLPKGRLGGRLASWPRVRKKERKQSSLPCSVVVCPGRGQEGGRGDGAVEGVAGQSHALPQRQEHKQRRLRGSGSPRMGNSRASQLHRPLSKSGRRGGRDESWVCPDPSPGLLQRGASGEGTSHFSLT